MSLFNATAAIIDATAVTDAPAIVGAIAAPTKEQRIAKLEEQIVKLQQRIQDIKEGKPAKAAAPVRPLPAVGDVVNFKYGRKTADTEPRVLVGTVLGVKAGATLPNGKAAPTLIKVQFGEGFDVETAVIYPAALVEASEPAQDTATE